MWLPRPVYEAMPYAGLAAGLACFALAYYTERGPRGIAFVLGVLFATVGVMLWMKRRDYRSTQADYNPRALDE